MSKFAATGTTSFLGDSGLIACLDGLYLKLLDDFSKLLKLVVCFSTIVFGSIEPKMLLPFDCVAE